MAYKKRRRVFRHSSFPFVQILVGFISFWAILWIFSYLQFNRQFENWLISERMAGREFTYKTSVLRWSPIAITKELNKLEWKTNKFAITAEKISIVIRPWNWRSIKISFDDIKIAFGKGEKAYSINGDNLTLLISSPFFQAEEHSKTGLGLKISTDRLVIETMKPLPFGDTVEKLNIELRVMGSPPDFLNAKSVSVWNDKSGVVEFDKIEFNWGVLKLAVNGTLGFNSKLQPEGAFSGRVGDRRAVINALEERKWINKTEASLINSTLNLLTKSISEGKKEETLPISVQEGGIYLGPARVLDVPSIDWQ